MASTLVTIEPREKRRPLMTDATDARSAPSTGGDGEMPAKATSANA